MPVRTGILIVSADDPTAAEESARAVVALLQNVLVAFFLVQRQTLPSQRYLIEECLRRWCDEEEMDLIVTIGGTFPAAGPSPDEIVPEATQAVVERFLPSLPETMRAATLDEEPLAILDRGVAGIRGRTVLINLPAGPHLATRFLETIVDLLAPILARLAPGPDRQEPSVDDQLAGEDAPAANRPAPRTKKLDADEFAEFLRTRHQDDSD